MPEDHLELSLRQKKVLSIYVGDAEYSGRKACILFEEELGQRFPQATFAKLVKRPQARAYIDELQYHQGIRVTSVRNKVVEEYSALGFSNIAEIISVKENGAIVIRAFDELPKATQKSIKKIKLVRRKISGGEDGEFEDVLEIEMHDKIRALDGLTDVLNLKRRIEDELTEQDEKHVLQFAGVKIIGPSALPEPPLPELEVIEL